MKRRNGRVKNVSKRNAKANEMVKKTAVAAGAIFGAVGLVNNEVYAESQKEVTDETLVTHNQITVKDEASASTSESLSQSASLSAQEVKRESEKERLSASASKSTAESLKDSQSVKASEFARQSESMSRSESLKASESNSRVESTKASESTSLSESQKASEKASQSDATSESKSEASQSAVKTESQARVKVMMASNPTQEKTSEVVSKMTNKEDYSNKKIYTIDETGKAVEATKDEAAKAKDYMNTQNVTADEDIYADQYNATIGHIDGNIAISRLNTSVQIYNKDQYGVDSGKSASVVSKEYSQNGYSYIGDASEKGVITNGDGGNNKATLVFGEKAQNTSAYNNVKDNNVNYHIMTIEDARASTDSRYSDLEDLINITDNLTNIGNKGQALIDATQVSNDGYTTLLNLGNAIASHQYSNDDMITVTVSSDLFTDTTHANDWQNNGVFNKLYNSNANKGNTNIIINVKVKDGVTNIDLGNIGNALMNATQSYSSRAAYVTWNFGNYSGMITGNFSGNLIAPKANYEGIEIRSGRVVAEYVSHSNELHMSVKGTYKTEEHNSESESTSKSETESNSKSESESHSKSESESKSESNSDTTSESKSKSDSVSKSTSNSDSTSGSKSESESTTTSESGSGSTSEYSTSESQSTSTSVTTSESSSESNSLYSSSETESTSVSYTSEESGSASQSQYQNLESSGPSVSEATDEEGSNGREARTSETISQYEAASSETSTSGGVATGDPTNIAKDVGGLAGGAIVAGVTLTKKHKK